VGGLQFNPPVRPEHRTSGANDGTSCFPQTLDYLRRQVSGWQVTSSTGLEWKSDKIISKITLSDVIISNTQVSVLTCIEYVCLHYFYK
jgi:hypothetical protein